MFSLNICCKEVLFKIGIKIRVMFFVFLYWVDIRLYKDLKVLIVSELYVKL